LRRLRSKFTAGSASVVNPRVGGSHGDQAQALAMVTYGLAEASEPEPLFAPAMDMPDMTRGLWGSEFGG
jgi:hypothetical protein